MQLLTRMQLLSTCNHFRRLGARKQALQPPKTP
jgi:hypothetical protein